MSDIDALKERLEQLDDWVAKERKYLLELIAMLEGATLKPLEESCTT